MTELNLGPALDDDVSHAEAQARADSIAELMQTAARRVLRDHETGLRDDPHALEWARGVLLQKSS